MDRFSYIYLFKYDLKSESENQCTFYLSYAGMQIQPTKVQIQHEILFFFYFNLSFWLILTEDLSTYNSQ